MIQRQIEHKIHQSLKREEITMLIGARQVGKTTILKKIKQALENENKKTLFLNFDIEQDASHLVSQQSLLNRIQLEFGEDGGYVFIDEIQQKQDAGKFLKGLYDMNLPYKLIVTGSGSIELKEKVSESLLGRKHLMYMSPVTFAEYINYKTNYKYTDRLKLYCSTHTNALYDYLTAYLAYGGYPRIVSESNREIKLEIINELFRTYLSRDISALLNLRSPDKFTHMLRILATRVGNIISYSSLAYDTNLATDTLRQYLWYAQHTFIIEEAKPYFTNPGKELVKSPVFYFNDLGLLNFALGRFGNFDETQSSFLFENFVFLQLREKHSMGIDNIRFWRTKEKAEVDFVVRQEGKIIPYEVKFSHLKTEKISRSFRSFITKYNPEKSYIVNLSLDSELLVNNTIVKFIPYWKLLFL